jgi:hypothetical protein
VKIYDFAGIFKIIWVGCQDIAGLSGNIYLFKNRKYFLAMEFIAFDVKERVEQG